MSYMSEKSNIEMEKEKFANKLGFKIVERNLSSVTISATPDMSDTNALDMTHGGFLFSFADYASALLSNTEEKIAVSNSVYINYIAPCPPNKEIFAKAVYFTENVRTAIVDVNIFDSSNNIFATMQARLSVRQKS